MRAMMKPVYTAALLSISLAAMAPSAQALASCSSQAQTIKAGQKQAKALQAEREAQVWVLVVVAQAVPVSPLLFGQGRIVVVKDELVFGTPEIR